jgi:hypothetical protein
MECSVTNFVIVPFAPSSPEICLVNLSVVVQRQYHARPCKGWRRYHPLFERVSAGASCNRIRSFGGKHAEDGRHGNGADLGSEAVLVECTNFGVLFSRAEADQCDSQCDCIFMYSRRRAQSSKRGCITSAVRYHPLAKCLNESKAVAAIENLSNELVE